MAFVWKPSLYRSGQSLFVLPQPIAQVKIVDAIKSETHEVPMLDGGKSYGPTKKPVSITVTGEIGVQDGTQKITEEEMWTVYENLRNYCSGATDAAPLEFFAYHDSGSATYRKFKRVFWVGLDIDTGDQNRLSFPYELQLRADDTTIYTTAPGS